MIVANIDIDVCPSIGSGEGSGRAGHIARFVIGKYGESLINRYELGCWPIASEATGQCSDSECQCDEIEAST